MRKILVCIVFSVGVVACNSNDSAEKITEPLCSTPSIECLLPWPNDALTVFEKTADKNGRQLNLQEAWMPTNATEKPIDVTDMNRANGFSPGSAILLLVPGVNLAASKLPTSDHIEDSLNKDAGIVITDKTTKEAIPYWAELDARATSDTTRLLIVHPAVSLLEGHTHEVRVQSLKDIDGNTLKAPKKWSFTVADTESLSKRLLHIRAEAYTELANKAPKFTVTSSQVEQVAGADVRTVTGTFDVPLFLSKAEPGGTFTLDANGLPQRGVGMYPSRFICVMPNTALSTSSLPIVYGHGLLGGAEEALSFKGAVAEQNATVCATDWIGMASLDLLNVGTTLLDMSSFSSIADRLQQGMVNFQFLGRLFNHKDGFASSQDFQSKGKPIFELGGTQFLGSSQGGILGGAASAVSSEWSRAVLGVPGLNYSLLLTRSIDWDEFAAIFEKAYTGDIERVMALQLVQLLWDRGENNGYVQHLTANTYDSFSPKDVLLIEAFGDHQVANVSTEILARTIGARVHTPVFGAKRSSATIAMWGLEPLSDARAAPALVLWDFANPAPPADNRAPTFPKYGEDPHGAGSDEPRVATQVFTFLKTGKILDVCNSAPCTSDVLTR